MLILFLLTTALVGVPVTSCKTPQPLLNHAHWPRPLSPGTDGFFAITLLSVFLMNAASSVFQSSTFGFAGVLPHNYTAAVMSGQVSISPQGVVGGANSTHRQWLECLPLWPVCCLKLCPAVCVEGKALKQSPTVLMATFLWPPLSSSSV